MAKKQILTLALLITVGNVLIAIDESEYSGTPLVVAVDSDVWVGDSTSDVEKNRIAMRIKAGEKVYGLISMIDVKINGRFKFVTQINYENNKYFILSDNLRPSGNEFLPESWITTLTDNSDKKWVMSYFLDVLYSRNRDTFLTYEKTWIDFITGYIKEWQFQYQEGTKWWNESRVEESLVISRAGIIMCGLKGWFNDTVFHITNVIPLQNESYSLILEGDAYYTTIKTMEEGGWLPFPPYDERKSFAMIFIPDGDYMDVYLDSLDRKFASFAKVDSNILTELNKLVETNTCDLTNVVRPRRAPKQFTAGEECRVLENLRMRETPDTAGTLITTLEPGSRVTILEIGKNATIDGVTSPWVKAEAADGETGWCFGLYLQTAKFDPTPEELARFAAERRPQTRRPLQKTVEAEKPAETKSALWIILVIGGIIAIGCGAVIAVKRKK
jgi:hypothetical protein